jgi:hypothetical protein
VKKASKGAIANSIAHAIESIGTLIDGKAKGAGGGEMN